MNIPLPIKGLALPLFLVIVEVRVLSFINPGYAPLSFSKLLSILFVSSLQEAVVHARRPMEVLEVYDEVSKLINETLTRANETKIAIDHLMNYVSVLRRKKGLCDRNFDQLWCKSCSSLIKTKKLRKLSYKLLLLNSHPGP